MLNLAEFASFADITDAVMSIGFASRAATGRESDAKVLNAVMGSWLRTCRLASVGEACNDGLAEILGEALPTFAALADVTDAVMSITSALCGATGRESDGKVLSA